MSNTNCIICQSRSEHVFEKKIFSKDVKYFLCSNCGFLFTERPSYWLEQAYNNAITSLDLGLVNRNLLYAEMLSWYIKVCSKPSGRFLDFGGGYGLLTRMMRDKGFDYYRQDNYCENLFAKYFDVTEYGTDCTFDLVSAFEVFEHLEDPLFEIRKMLKFGKTIFFSTEIIPDKDISNWYYLLPEIGQHISFYSEQSLNKIAELNGCFYYKISNSLHVISKNRISFFKLFLFKRLAINYARSLQKLKFNTRHSLLMKDFDWVKQKLFNN